MTTRPRKRPAPGSTFIDPAVLARIDDLELLARSVVDGFMHGLHRSPYLGLSREFAEHRPYMPGDDIRRIDWRLFARTDRHYVKRFEAETNANVVFALDVSPSMAYGSGEVEKLDYARFLVASLAYFSRRQRDRVGILTFDGDAVEWVPPSARHLDLVLHAVGRASPGARREEGDRAIGAPLARLGAILRRRGIVVVVSDLYEAPGEILGAVKDLRYRGHDVVLFHVLDPAEVDFPFREAASFVDAETGRRIPVVPGELRERYRRLVREHLEALEEMATGHRIDYALLDTSEPLDDALHRYLASRGRLRRVR